MPRRSKVYELPAEIQGELNKRLVQSGFGDYRGLSDWLESQGYRIGKSALADYGASVEAQFEATMATVRATDAMAKAYVEANPDEAGAMTGATVRIAQESLLRIVMSLRQAEEDPAALAKLMPSITRALADLGRLDISRGKWGRELREAAAREAVEQERINARGKLDALANTEAKRGGALDAETLRRIREEIYGIVEQPVGA